MLGRIVRTVVMLIVGAAIVIPIAYAVLGTGPVDLVFVHGELWRARPRGGQLLKPGQQVRVAEVGPELVLEVEPVVPAE